MSVSRFMVLIFIALGFSINASANEDHTANFCSATDAKVCAHVGHMTNMKKKMDSEFMIHVLVPKEVTHFTADLWMPEHDHGTTPLEITPMKKNKFKILFPK